MIRSGCLRRQFSTIIVAWAFSAALSSAATVSTTEPFVGVRHYHRTTTSPRLLDMHIVEIDPRAAGIDFLVTPSNGSAPGETSFQTTRAFVTQQGAQIGINGMFFSSSAGGANVSGLAASDGTIYSTFEPGRDHAINFTPSNVASIIRGTTGSGTAHTPATTLYNALTGSERIVNNGLVTAGSSELSTALHPRSAAGVTADGTVLLFTVDGRNDGHSLGMSLSEVAEVLIQYGARNAINLDGGGSTTMVFADPTPRLVNIPKSSFTSPSSERAVANNLAVFAQPKTGPAANSFLFADFEAGDSGPFGYDLTYSGSTEGILAETSVSGIVNTSSHSGQRSQRLQIRHDPAVSGTPENPAGWFVRHVAGNPGAGAPASRTANTIRATDGHVGFWAQTTAPGIEVALAVDSSANVTADRGIRRPLIADGLWHRYSWNLEDDDEWEGWINGDGTISSSTFTLDSIQIFGQRANATVFIDDVFHEITPGLAPIAGDFNDDRVVDKVDLALWRHAFGVNAGGDADNDGDTDGADFLRWQRSAGSVAASNIAATSVPEPAAHVLVALVMLLSPRRLVRT